jgi:hypothetical protein
MAFDKRQIKAFVNGVKKRAGDGWDMLGPRFQKALITEEAFYVMSSQVESMTFGSAALHELNNAMLEEAGLSEVP